MCPHPHPHPSTHIHTYLTPFPGRTGIVPGTARGQNWPVLSKLQSKCMLWNFNVHLSGLRDSLAADMTQTHATPTLHNSSRIIKINNISIIIITVIISNTYIAPNPTTVAQSTSQFKTRLDMRINTWNMHTPDGPTPTGKHRQTCTHPGIIIATQSKWNPQGPRCMHIIIASKFFKNKNNNVQTYLVTQLKGVGKYIFFKL